MKLLSSIYRRHGSFLCGSAVAGRRQAACWLVLVLLMLAGLPGCQRSTAPESGPSTPARAFSELVDGLWNHDLVRIERHLSEESLDQLREAAGSGAADLGAAVQAVWLPMEGDIRSSTVEEQAEDQVTLVLELHSGHRVEVPGQRVGGVWKFDLLAPHSR